ncbi:hypothetical protein BG004_000943 [Podila humilis]|nr:hypothetical protein BG004_000943 [Podila humilis]
MSSTLTPGAPQELPPTYIADTTVHIVDDNELSAPIEDDELCAAPIDDGLSPVFRILPPTTIPPTATATAATDSEAASSTPPTTMTPKRKTKRSLKNLDSLIAFAIQLAGLIGLISFGLHQMDESYDLEQVDYMSYSTEPGIWKTELGFPNRRLMEDMMVAISPGFAFGILLLLVTNIAPGRTIRLALLVTLGANAVNIVGSIIGSVTPIVPIAMSISVLHVIVIGFFWWRQKRHFQFNKILLEAAWSTSRKHYSIPIISLGALLAQLGFTVFVAKILPEWGIWYYPDLRVTLIHEIRSALAFGYLSYFWTSQVISNIAYSAISSIATLHYCPPRVPAGGVLPRTILKYVFTTSFGTICYTSAILVPWQMVHTAAMALKESHIGVKLGFADWLASESSE